MLLLATTFLMLLSSGIEYDEDDEWKRRHMDPTNGMTYLMVSDKYPRAKMEEHDPALQFSEGDPTMKNMWLLLKDDVSGAWTIRAAGSGRRIQCDYDGYIYNYEPETKLYDDQLWKFVDKNDDGYYRIESYASGKAKWCIGTYNGQAGGCYPNPKACTSPNGCSFDMGFMDGDCDTDWVCWGDMRCGKSNCKFEGHVSNDDCCIKDGESDDSYIGKRWRLEDIFVSEAMWKQVAMIKNDRDSDFDYEIDQSHGYTKSFSQSAAHTHSVTNTLKASAGFSFKKLDLGVDKERTVTDDYNQAVEAAASEQYTITQKVKVPVAAGDCIQVMQLACTQDDRMSGIKDMQFTSLNTWVRDCPDESKGDNPLIPMDEYKAKFPNSMTVVQSSLFKSGSEVESPSFVVYGLAAIGFAFLGYGAVKHYSKN